MFKKLIFLGASAGVTAALASFVYARIYNSSLGADFSSIVNPAGIITSSLLGSLLAAIAYYFFNRWSPRNGEIIFNFFFVILTFASILGPFATKLPLEIETPELFPGLTVPMHFFPALAWFTLKPIFIRPVKRESNLF